MTAKAVRHRLLYTGNVQGVGFRYTASRIAQSHVVTGFVRNLPDGRVELVAEGEEAAVEAFLNEVARAMASYIRRADSHVETATGQWKAFTIAR